MESTSLKKTALHALHISLGAKMVPFAGFDMPVRYSGDVEEHLTVRKGVGVFDVSHMGEFLVSGPDALSFLEKVSSNKVAALVPGKVQYSCLPNGKGGIVDDLLVYCLAENQYLLVVNASNMEKDWNWLNSHKPTGAVMEDISDNTSLFAVQGPKAAEALQSLTSIDLKSMVYYTFERSEFAGVPDVLISATGYTGAGGFEIYVANQSAETVWKAIFQAGKNFDIKPIGLGARDTLRLEMGFCLYGNDIDDTTSPIEAGLGWITKFSKEFIDKELLESQKANGTNRKLTGFILEDKGIARAHYPICLADGSHIGEVTSGTQSPVLGKAIGLGYIATEHAKKGNEVFIEVRGKLLKAIVSPPPFTSGTL